MLRATAGPGVQADTEGRVSLALLRGDRSSPLPRPAVLAVLRLVRDGSQPACDVPTIDLVTEAIVSRWLEVVDDRKRVERWRYRLTAEGRKRAGPALRLIVGGRA